MRKQHIKISGDLMRADTIKVKGIDENGKEIDLNCYKFIIEADVRNPVSKVTLFCHGVEIDVEGEAEIIKE